MAGFGFPFAAGFSFPFAAGFSFPFAAGFSFPFAAGFSFPFAAGFTSPFAARFSFPFAAGFAFALQLDAALIRATDRAQGLATSPVLQAGILTDAATLEDIFATELDIRTRPGETIELFQVRGDTATSLVRVPANATPLARVPGVRARIADRNGLAVVAVAPVVPYTKAADVAGELVVAASVDLSTLQLARTTLDARLVAAAAVIPLVAERASVDGMFEVPVPIDARWQLGALSLEAVPVLTASRESWLLPVRYAALGLGSVFLTAFVVALRGTRRR